MRKIAVAVLVAFALVLSSASAFGYGDGMDMIMDVLIARPVALAATVIGTAMFFVALPFSMPSGSVGSTACALVVTPCKYTFVRPIGDFSQKWGDVNCLNAQPAPRKLDKSPEAVKPSGS